MKFATELTRLKLEGPMVVQVAEFADLLRRNQSLKREIIKLEELFATGGVF